MKRFDKAVCEYWGIHERPDRCVCRPLHPWTRWTLDSRGPVGRGSLISKTVNWFVQFPPLFVPSAFLPSFRARRVAVQPTGSKKKSAFGGDCSGGHFFDRGPVGQFSLDIGHSYSRFFATIGRVAKSTTCSNFSRTYGKSSLFYVYPGAVQFSQNIVAKFAENWCLNEAKIFNF